MQTHPRQLPIPDLAAQDGQSIELARVWATKGKQHVSLATGLWEDPASWGIFLVDLAKHISNAYCQDGQDRHAVLRRVREGFDAEWGDETDKPTGAIKLKP